MCSIIPEAWNIHTVIVMFQHELFVHSVAALPHLVRHCSLFNFVYILPSASPNGNFFIKQYFKLKEQTICNVYNIIPEAWNIQACEYMQACGPVWIFLFRIKRTLWHIRTQNWPISHFAVNIWICPLSHQSQRCFKRMQFKWNFLCTLWIKG